MKLPTLYHRTKRGATQEWTVWTEGAFIVTAYGQKDGLVQQARKRAAPVNTGKTNFRSAVEQAEFEARALWEHKRTRKYRETIEETAEPLPLPMLAHDYAKHRAKVVLPCHVQPKLNGARCLAVWRDGKIVLCSRSGRPWDVPHIAHDVASVLPADGELDGEMYIHGVDFQRIISLAKRNRRASAKLRYHVYDAPVIRRRRTASWAARYAHLVSLLPEGSWRSLRLVPTYCVTDLDLIHDLQRRFVEEGYEGAIVRNRAGKYLHGYRSHDLLKVKTWRDAEFTVKSMKQGRGKMRGCAIFVCVIQGRRRAGTFDVVRRCSMKERRRDWRNRKDLIGKLLKVKFFDYTRDGKPWFPVGLGFRDLIDTGTK